MAEMIKIDALNKSFGTLRAVRDLSFRVGTGELFAFLGVNGAGKSTTIHMMCGQLAKDSGRILIDGVDIDADVDAVKAKIGVVFQNSVLDQRLSVRDNLESRAALQGGSIMHGWMKDDRVMIACCNDGTRPVIFKIERIDVDE